MALYRVQLFVSMLYCSGGLVPETVFEIAPCFSACMSVLAVHIMAQPQTPELED